MKRIAMLGLSAAAAVAFGMPAHASTPYCGTTFKPPCSVCVNFGGTVGPRCVRIDVIPEVV